MPSPGKVSPAHEHHHQLSGRKGIHYPLGIQVLLTGQSVGGCRCRDQAVVGTVALTAVSVCHRPPGQLHRVMNLPGQGGYYNRHGCGAASTLPDGAGCAVHHIRPALIHLIVVHDLHAAIREHHALIGLAAASDIVRIIDADVLVIAVFLLKGFDSRNLAVSQCPLHKHGNGAGQQVDDKGYQKQQKQYGRQYGDKQTFPRLLIRCRLNCQLCQYLCRYRVNCHTNSFLPCPCPNLPLPLLPPCRNTKI